MKWMLHPAAAAAGMSFVCCVSWAGPLVSPYHSWVYHSYGAVDTVFVSVLLSMVLLWLLLTFVFSIAAASGRIRVFVWSGVILFTPWLLLKDVVLLAGWNFPHWLSLSILAVSGLCWIAVNALWRASIIPLFERAQNFSSTLLAFGALGAVLAIGQLSWCLWDARSLGSPELLHTSSGQAAGQAEVVAPGQRPRVIWIILDELSYEQVYERRFPSLDLPAFDQLARQSTVFTHVAPAATYTEAAVPSLMTGLRVDRIQANGDGTLHQMHDPVTGRWQPFHAQDTIFQDALNHGFRTAVAGWYNPYCRILSAVLNRCQWAFRENYEGEMSADASIATNMFATGAGLLAHVRLHGRVRSEANSEAIADAHLADYRDIVSGGDQLLRDSSIDFLLLHIPVPHPGGIYDRRTGSFTNHPASYIDNLALADRYLGHVIQVLQQRGEWDSSAVLVMGDHSWRTRLLEGSPEWTPEDQVASHGGQFDDRPGYIVKLPHQAEGARVETPFAATRTRALLAGIVDGSIRSVPELEGFAGQGVSLGTVSTRLGGGGWRSRGR